MSKEHNEMPIKMKNRLFISLGVLCCLVAVLVVNSAFTTRDEIVISSNTPFPQTGSIKVYKYKLTQKVEIGELQWSATTRQMSERRINGRSWSEVTLRVHNTTDEYVKSFFTFKGDNGSISFEVRPEDTYETTEICSSSVTGVVPASKEITLH